MSSVQPPPLREQLLISGKMTAAWESWFNKIAKFSFQSAVATDGYLVNNGGTTFSRTFTSSGSTITLTNPSGTAGNTNLEVSDAFLYGGVAGTVNEITVADDGDGTITLSMSASYFSNRIAGTTGEITVTDNGDGTVTLSIPDPATLDELNITKDISLTSTTNSNQLGLIKKGTDRFIHDFNYGDNGTVITKGKNIFLGLGSGNLTMGATATSSDDASYNVAIGDSTFQANIIGKSNCCIGYNSMNSNTEGGGNVAIGYVSLELLTTGDNNVAIGGYALSDNVTGSGNVAIGHSALKVVNRSNNVAIGQGSLAASLSDQSNVAIGQESQRRCNGGESNTSIGRQSLYSNVTGDNNTAIGFYAGRYISDGSTANDTCSNSIFIGRNAYPSANSETNQIVIGYAATGQGSNSVTLGNSSITKTLLRGDVELDSGGLQLTTTSARPAAGAAYRGMMWITQGGAGVADTTEVCLKSAADTYSWVTIATG